MVSMIVPTMAPHDAASATADCRGAGRRRLLQLRAVGPPHVHDRHPGPLAGLFFGSQHGGVDPKRHPDVRLDRNAGFGPAAHDGRVALRAGLLFMFTLGGLTGVMVAIVPFDWQAHDTYFVVAHLHYVLFGGMVFPLFAAIYYWAPAFSRRPLSERLGKWAFSLIFAGFNIAFLPMHLTGLVGMPRRVYTYSSHLGWGSLNMISTVGAFILAAGILVFIIDLSRNIRLTNDEPAGDVWNAGTLEWLPNSTYAVRSIPLITSRYPLWEQSNLARDVKDGRYFLPGTATGWRETLRDLPWARLSLNTLPVCLGPVGRLLRGSVYGGLLLAPHGQAGRFRRDMRGAGRRVDGDLDVAKRSGACRRRPHWKRRPASNICDRAGVPLLVGNDHSHRGRRGSLFLLRLRIPLYLDGCAAATGPASIASPALTGAGRPYWHLRQARSSWACPAHFCAPELGQVRYSRPLSSLAAPPSAPAPCWRPSATGMMV